MKMSFLQKKWAKITAVLIAVVLLFGGIFYYIILKRFERIIQLTVTSQSDGLYFFDADKVKLNMLKKSILVKNAVVYCTDTTRVNMHHELKIPNMFLRINSWSDLIFNKKIIVDSLDIQLPSLVTYDHLTDKKEEKSIAFHTSSIFDMLHQLAANLEIRSLNIQNGAYTYSNDKNNRPFFCNHIYLIIKNFSKKEGKVTQLFSADDLDISLYDQHWELPSGIHDISFKRVHFSGKNQFFELDTCSFHKAAEPGTSEITLSADHFFFNSKRLTAIQEQEELLIDTLICFRPVLSLIPADKKQIIPDSIASVSQSIKGIFKNINFKYIDIREGQLALTPINSYDTLNTTKTNLKIFNLAINPSIEPHITTDSIKLNLNKILFYTKDSLNQLSVDEFRLHNNDIIFNNAEYGPTPRNQSGKTITFTTTSLLLKNIDLEALVKKKLKASQADLHNPTISMSFPGTEKKRKGGQKKTALFFETLHDISELIEVPDFNILHGTLHYTMGGATPLKMEMKNMNAHILLTNFLVSDSLIDIKRSVPALQVDVITVKSPGLKLLIKGYNFVGKYKHNLADNFEVTLANGSSIKGKYLYWELLDWDQFVNHQEIKVETILVKELTIHSKSETSPAINQTKIKLPQLDLHRINIGHLNFINTHPNHSFQFSATAAGIDNISSKNDFLVWQKAEATIQDLVFNSKNSFATIGKINFNNEGSVINETSFTNNNENGGTKVMIPEMKIKAAIYSTDLSRLHLASLVANHPQIDLYNQGNKEKKSTGENIRIPIPFVSDKFIVNDAIIHHRRVNEKDTTTFVTNASIEVSDLQNKANDSTLISYSYAAIDLSDFQFKNNALKVDIPKISGTLTNSKVKKNYETQLSFNSELMVNWFAGTIKLQKPGLELDAIHINGSFNDTAFSIQPGKNLQWQQLASRTTLKDVKAFYKNDKRTIKTGYIEWDPYLKTFWARKYSIMPNMGAAETFSKAKWQQDYLTIEGEAISISGLQLSQLHKDSILGIKRITLENNSLQATRDRNIPFRQNVEKLMPGAILNNLKKKIQVDSIFVIRSNITIHEIALKTNKKATIPITDLNAVITHFNNITEDSVTLTANAYILNNKITNFYYKEAIKDSLSFFQAQANLAPMQLTHLNDATIPMANIRIKTGSVDTLFATWAGNKHAAAGTMNFYYNNLKIQLLNKNDTAKNRFIPSVASSIFFRKKNDKPAMIYFSRDKEKFVFNYWVKTIASGILTSAGLKKNKQYRKQYNAVKEKYALPEMNP